ncbi:MAG: hypothetical protein M5U12_34860 [Verrucomicrobia bacterium]|nr:hypothetical protein [Verrucomicrobiota bacterium]
MIVTLDAKRRVSIPAALAPTAPGDQFDASFDAEDDVVVLRRIKAQGRLAGRVEAMPLADG